MRVTYRVVSAALLVWLLAGFLPIEKLFAPGINPWPFWQVSDEDNQETIDHAGWSGFLKRYLSTGADGITRVAYGEVASTDHDSLKAYVEKLVALPVRTYNSRQQLAYWINLYNARTVMLILDHYPVASVRDIDLSGWLASSGPWDVDLMQVEDQDLSLNDIEHRILRPFWKDPRLHYALNCASLGCPNLQGTAFTPKNTEVLLDKGARDYINHPRAVRREEGGLSLSKIYVWFADDFGAYEEDLISHLMQYAGPDLKKILQAETTIKGFGYDWSLNDKTTP